MWLSAKSVKSVKWSAVFGLVGGLIVQTIIPLPAQKAKPVSKPKPVPQANVSKLQPYVLTLPDSLVKIKMVPIPGGTMKVGTQTITIKPFYMATTETPWEAYDVFTQSGPPSPSYGQDEIAPDAIALPSKSYILPDLGWGHAGYPTINISSLAVTMFNRWLASKTGKKYRLPTEYEWEWACRAGAVGAWKMDKALADKSAWHSGNSEKVTHPIGKKLPNAYGLYDMLGNVGEWATDKDNKPVLCGGTFLDLPTQMSPTPRQRWSPKWQETDPQFPKSRWWLSDGKFVGFRLFCEP